MNEVWKDIQGFEGIYQVSSIGNIKSLEREILYKDKAPIKVKEKILKLHNTLDYRKVNLCKENTRGVYKVHRLVAIAFIDNPENKKYVNHKNGIKSDNRVENLEWATAKENTIHSWVNNLSKTSDKVREANVRLNSKIVLNTQTGIFYDSAIEAASVLGVKVQTLRWWIGRHCKNNKSSFIYA